jgi:hypothetical protein
MNAPVLLVTTSTGNVLTLMLPNFIDTFVLGAKFDPVTVTSVPVGPDAGEIVMMPAVVTLNTVEADLPEESVTDIV